MSLVLTYGSYRHLTPEEKEGYMSNYKYVVLETYYYECDGKCIEVLPGFLSDGASGGPDKGTSWVYHDYLYATHCFKDSTECTRKEADKIMEQILEYEGQESQNMLTKMFWSGYEKTVSCLSYFNPFYAMTDAWESSGDRGPEFLELQDDC